MRSISPLPRLALVIVFTIFPSLVAASPPIAPTEALAPQGQRTRFTLPPGFEIQLVASEPAIQKPMNMAFDARGRLWVSHSTEYPFPAAEGETARDGITILDGFGPDGLATRATQFADGLNIPIGVLPLGDGREAIVWSIPNIWKLSDTDDDGVADRREVLYGPFDFVDTHGNQNAFRLGLDGWVYACHGFRNASHIRLPGEGDVALTLESGNTYRFRTDGSAIEQVSWGQVNPFGACFDPRADLFTADCHSKPITMILRGGCYESFGKPHDGLGFAPVTTSNDHGSTAIAGIAYYDADQFPAEFRDCFYVGNVVTNRVHRDRPVWRGSSPWVDRPDDFVTCDDWWFRPVDIRLGPDGALYIADFYNCIIGHYEVDLNHPRRDRHRGRIWRVIWQGDDRQEPPEAPAVNLSTLSFDQLADRLGDRNLVVRTAATHEFCRRFGPSDVPALLSRISNRTPSSQAADPRAARAQAHSVWIALRTGTLDRSMAERFVREDPIVRVHLSRALAEMTEWDSWQTEIILGLLGDDDPFVRRAAVEALGRHSDLGNIQPLLHVWASADLEDLQLIHAARIALRNQLRDATDLSRLSGIKLSEIESQCIAEIALAVPSEAAAWFAFEYVREHAVPPDVLDRCMAHAARHVGPQRLDEVAAFAETRFASHLPRQVSLLQSLLDGLNQRGSKLQADSSLGRWASALATRLLDPQQRPPAAWLQRPLDNSAAAGEPSPWGVRPRACADGQTALVFDSIVGGEALTGILRSAPFEIPKQLSFWMCGHNGHPGTNPPPANHIRLRRVDSGEVVARDVPPRNDTARKFTWDLTRWAGQQGLIEIVDANTDTAYAWIGVGRFDPPVVTQPAEGFSRESNQLELALHVATQLRMDTALPHVMSLLEDRENPPAVRVSAAAAAIALNREQAIDACRKMVRDPAEPAALRIVAAQLLTSDMSDETRAALVAGLLGATSDVEFALAHALCSHAGGAEDLLRSIADGKATARLLQDEPLRQRLAALNLPGLEQRISSLTAGLPPLDEAVGRLIAQRAQAFRQAKASRETGQAVFKKNCSACHRIGDEGGRVGPQLDGIGTRGAERLLEDILDPNRHVDAAFRAMIVLTASGRVVTGLRLREEGRIIVLADQEGKEIRINNDDDIEESRLSNQSPMPANFAEKLPESDLYDLIEFLLNQREAPPRPT